MDAKPFPEHSAQSLPDAPPSDPADMPAEEPPTEPSPAEKPEEKPAPSPAPAEPARGLFARFGRWLSTDLNGH